MKNRILMASILLTVIMMVVACGTLELSGSGGKAVLSSMDKVISNSTNTTSNNSTNIQSNSTNSSTSDNASNKTRSDLWKWGSLPAGYTMKNNQIVPSSSEDSDNESVMETPSQLVPDNNPAGNGGMLVKPR